MYEGVKLSPLDKLPVCGIVHFLSVALGWFLHRVLAYRLLALFQRPRKVAFGLRVGRYSVGRDGVHVEQMGEIVFVTVLHRIELLFKTGYTVEIDIVTGRKGMIETVGPRILLGRTRRKQQHEG